MRGSKNLETINALGLSSCFITFSVFGTPDETLALVFDILRQFFLEQNFDTKFNFPTFKET